VPAQHQQQSLLPAQRANRPQYWWSYVSQR